MRAIKITPATTTTINYIPITTTSAIETTTSINNEKLTENALNLAKNNQDSNDLTENSTTIALEVASVAETSEEPAVPVDETKHLKNIINIIQANQESCACEFHCGVCCCNGLCDYFNLVTCEIQAPTQRPITELENKLWSLLSCRSKNSDYWCRSQKDPIDALTPDEKREVCLLAKLLANLFQ